MLTYAVIYTKLILQCCGLIWFVEIRSCFIHVSFMLLFFHSFVCSHEILTHSWIPYIFGFSDPWFFTLTPSLPFWSSSVVSSRHTHSCCATTLFVLIHRWWMMSRLAWGFSYLALGSHVTAALLFSFSSPLSTNRRRPNWSMPTLRSSNRAFSLKRPKLINSRGS